MGTPTRDPSTDVTKLGAIEFVIQKQIAALYKMLPAVVKSYEAESNRVVVEVLYKLTMNDGSALSIDMPTSIPVILLGAGGYVVSMPIEAGSLGWIMVADRDISKVLREYKASVGPTSRMHSIEDAIFLPDVMHGVTPSKAGATLQTLDGSTKVLVSKDTVEISCGGSSVLKVSSSGIEITGTVKASGDVVGAGISLQNHKHSGVQGGGSLTGGPV